MKNITVILRSAGERTEEAAMSLLRDFAGEVHLVKTAPFSMAVKECFETGIKDAKEWTLVIDADVLINPSGLAELVELSCGLSDDVFCVQGLVFDKLFSVYRPAGNHLYRTSLLAEASRYIDHGAGILRPESHVIDAMTRAGCIFIQTDKKIGLHDFEQSSSDIAKKAFLHGMKHAHLSDILLKFWGNSNDPDFRTAREFFIRGMEYKGALRVDSEDIAAAAFEGGVSLDEKPPYSPDGKIEADKLLTHDNRQNIVFPPNLWNRVKQGKIDINWYHYCEFHEANKIAVFGLGESGRKTLAFMSENFGKVYAVIDDNAQGKYAEIDIVSSDAFIDGLQDLFDLVVCGRYQKLNPRLEEELKIPLFRLDNIY